jgi:hypothetical protein
VKYLDNDFIGDRESLCQDTAISHIAPLIRERIEHGIEREVGIEPLRAERFSILPQRTQNAGYIIGVGTEISIPIYVNNKANIAALTERYRGLARAWVVQGGDTRAKIDHVYFPIRASNSVVFSLTRANMMLITFAGKESEHESL